MSYVIHFADAEWGFQADIRAYMQHPDDIAGPSFREESEPASGSFTSALGSEPPSSPEVPTSWRDAFRINPRPGLQADLDALAYDRAEFEDVEFDITDALPMGAPLFHHMAYTNPSNEWTDDEHSTWNPAWSYWDLSRNTMTVGPAPNGGWENPGYHY